MSTQSRSSGQSRRQSGWEVGIDFAISIAINLSIQAVFLNTFTLKRGLSFTAMFLLAGFVRRYLVRRGFNWMVGAQGQSRRMSLLEAVTDTVLAVGVAFAIVRVWYPAESMPRVSSIFVSVYILTMLRRYVIRRGFEWASRRGE